MVLMRAFIALEIPEEAKREISSAMAAVKSSIKPVPEENMHITIEFLGEISEERGKLVKKALEGFECNGFYASLGKVGTFGKLTSVAFVGIDEGRNEIESLRGRICSALGIGGNGKSYIPHITIARGGAYQLNAFAEEMNTVWKGGTRFFVGSVVLKKSELGGSHARHSLIFEKKLA